MGLKKPPPLLPPDCRWRILEEAGKYPGSGDTAYQVECSCTAKTRKIVSRGNLARGVSKSCGCLKNEVHSRRLKKYPVLPPHSRWRILEEAGQDKYGSYIYLVECSCPAKTRKIKVGWVLTQGSVLSCGCLKREGTAESHRRWPVLPPRSRWTIVKLVGVDKKRSTIYLVECSCSAKTRRIKAGWELTAGESLSCGCLQKEVVSSLFKKYPVLPPRSRWKILQETTDDRGRPAYFVECSCPAKTRRVIDGGQLASGRRLSCGCLTREATSKRNKKDPVLPPDSRWRIVGEAGRTKGKQVTYHVECTCPERTRRILPGTDLTAGHSRSCGCLKREMSGRNSRNGLRFSQAIEKYGHLADLEGALDRIEQEINPGVSDSTNPTPNSLRGKQG
jgi:hypothetical protein